MGMMAARGRRQGPDRERTPPTAPRVLLVHPSSELYGSDRVALESARAFVGAGARVHAVLAQPGPLVHLLDGAGCDVHVLPFPVLRKAYLSPSGLLRLLWITVRATPGMLRLLGALRPDVVYVSTVTVPWWLVLARLHRAHVVCHVHEAEQDVPRPVRFGLSAPLLLAHRIIANSRASEELVVAGVPRLRSRVEVIYNGVPGPQEVTPPRAELAPPVRLVLVGRVSARKGTDVAVAALAKLRERGVDATLDLVGGVFPGYEWFETQVRDQITALGLSGQVRWRGVCPEVWSALAEADVVLVPSRVEPFGNAAVEGMLAGRPVVAGGTQGLREIVRPGENGWLVRPGDPEDLAAAVTDVVEHWPAAREQVGRARREARATFDPALYRDRIARATLPKG
jgi:glycosyltransferase involved in cell wall biosynthesis